MLWIAAGMAMLEPGATARRDGVRLSLVGVPPRLTFGRRGYSGAAAGTALSGQERTSAGHTRMLSAFLCQTMWA